MWGHLNLFKSVDGSIFKNMIWTEMSCIKILEDSDKKVLGSLVSLLKSTDFVEEVHFLIQSQAPVTRDGPR